MAGATPRNRFTAARGKINLSRLSTQELLALNADVLEELRDREILRSSNNPTGDLAEFLFCRAFGWDRKDNSHASVDAICPKGVRYQIKGRRMRLPTDSRQLSAIRELDGEKFDFIAGVFFFPDYRVMRAAIIPRAVAVERAAYVKRTNSHTFILRDDIWQAENVRDVTPALQAVTF
jgi:hypothetical protein